MYIYIYIYICIYIYVSKSYTCIYMHIQMARARELRVREQKQVLHRASRYTGGSDGALLFRYVYSASHLNTTKLDESSEYHELMVH